jgi:hypothetical protein
MAVAGKNLTNNVSETDANSYTTASVSPTANNLILLTVVNRSGDSVNTVPTATGNGLTWVQVNSVAYDAGGSSRRTLTVLRAMGASPSSGAITIAFAGVTQTDCLWSVDQFSGIDTSGTNGSGAIVQSNTVIDPNGGTVTVTLAAFGSADNATFGAFGDSSTTLWTQGSGFTALGSKASTNNTTIFTEWKAPNDTSVDASGFASDAGGIGIEIKAAAAATAVKDLIQSGFVPFAR